MLVFFDTEVFKYDWLGVFITDEGNETVIVNDPDKLNQFYDNHKDEIWISYNGRHFDDYIIKGILLGFNPFEISDYIINKDRQGWEFSPLFNKIPLNDYDCIELNQSLKSLEGFMGSSIKETSVPFDINRGLTEAEIAETVKYCRHDVLQLLEVFLRKRNDFNARLDLIKTFQLSLASISKTKPQLTAEILECSRKERNDEWDIQLVDTLQIKKYKHIVDWFLNPENHNYENSLNANIAGIPHVFGWGGLHGCVDKFTHFKGEILHIDVTSFYPSLMIEYDFLTRNTKNKILFKEIYDKRVQLKKEGKKKEQAPLKLVLNSTYGILKDKFSSAYDPRQSNNVCINGQLILLDLIEHLEGHCSLIQSNTDGIFIQIKNEDYNKILTICNEWGKRVRMGFAVDEVSEMWQTKDVNSYIAKFSNGKFERKGILFKENSDLDNNLPIINEAIFNYLTKNIPIEQTINECEQLIKFQKIVKITKNYQFATHNDIKYTEKTFRVFASNFESDTTLRKCKFVVNKAGEKVLKADKAGDAPDHCFIENRDVTKMYVPCKLDRNWYVNLAKRKLNDKLEVRA